ncbi:MAG: SRPBCC family protein [Pirellulaceae bacterium]|nr:SRPBCC family protein [Pirellulaceae bacterium]
MLTRSADQTNPVIGIKKLGRSSWRLTTQALLPKPRHEVFPFFADAANLEKLTPEFLNFRILTPLPIEMRQGATIDYKIRLRGIPIRWRTNISVWQPNERFVDEQLRGPYRAWHHEHVFEEQGQQTLMTDVVNYRVWAGVILHPLLVEKDLQRIFGYRQSKMVELFS